MFFPLCLSQSNLSCRDAFWDFCLEQDEGSSAAFSDLRLQVPGRCCQQEGVELMGTSLLALLFAGPGESEHQVLGFQCTVEVLTCTSTDLSPAENTVLPGKSVTWSARMTTLLCLFGATNPGFGSRKALALPHSRDLVPFLQVWAGSLS